MREFELDPGARPHPQTLVARFGSWNGAKRKAGLVARRFATRGLVLHGQLRACARRTTRQAQAAFIQYITDTPSLS